MTVVDDTPGTDDRDPLVVAAGNASLLGIGYLLLGRRRTAAATGVVTLALLVTLVLSGSIVVEILVVVWWVVMIAHGWWLGRRSPVRVRRSRWLAFAPAVAVLLIAGLLRTNAVVIENAVDDARLRGDCPAAVAEQDGIWLGPRLGDAPGAARGDRTREVCGELAAAGAGLDRGLVGDVDALGPAYDRFAAVQDGSPGHERMVETTLDGFLAQLPRQEPCATAAATDWLRQRPVTHPSLQRGATTAYALAPKALLDCGDRRLRDRDWDASEARYRQLATQFPGGPLAARARQGAASAVAGREREQAEARLPQFCTSPFSYRGAPAPRPGTNPAVVQGGGGDLGRLPADWRTGDVTKAVLVVCAGDRTRGSVARTCPYTYGGGQSTDVRFFRVAVPVKVYEFRTGRVVLDTRVEVGGASCPETIRYSAYFDIGPPDQDVTASDGDVDAALRGALGPLVRR